MTQFHTRPRRAGLTVLLVLAMSTAVVTVAPGPVAYAATGVSVTGGQLAVTAAPGKVNDITITRQNDRLVVRDTGDVLTAGGGCGQVAGDPNAVSCPVAAVTFVSVDAGDLGDIVTYTANAPVTPGIRPVQLSGGAGNDLLQLGPSAPSARLLGGPGNDTHRGGGGDDILDGGEGPDGFFGGAGVDVVDYSSRSARVVADLDGEVNDDGEVNADDTPRERDTIKTDVERLTGGSGNDRLIGGAGEDLLFGGPGFDVLLGNGGNDTLNGSIGNDCLDGGAGDDLLNAIVSSGCMQGGAGNDTLVGGADHDFMDGGSGNDVLSGGDGDDTLVGGPGPSGSDTDTDVLSGGPGTLDRADYSVYFRPDPILVVFDDLANDGRIFGVENDNIRNNVEIAVGGVGNDVLRDPDPNVARQLNGFLGDDSINVFDGGPRDRAIGHDGVDLCAIDQGIDFAIGSDCELG